MQSTCFALIMENYYWTEVSVSRELPMFQHVALPSVTLSHALLILCWVII